MRQSHKNALLRNKLLPPGKSLPGEDTEKKKISKLLKRELQTVTRRAVNGKPLEKLIQIMVMAVMTMTTNCHWK